MNYQYLDDLFLLRFPQGFADEEFKNSAKRHRTSDKILAIIKNDFDVASLQREDTYQINKNIALILKIVTMSSMISVFEKVAFRNYLADSKIHETFLQALYDLITKKDHESFDNFVCVLNLRKRETNKRVATWPLVTFFLLYFDEYHEIFIKPNTIKRLIKLLEFDVEYVSYPNYETYQKIKEMVETYKKQSNLVKGQSNIMVQAVMYCALISENELF